MSTGVVKLPHISRSVIEADRVGAKVTFKDLAKAIRNAKLMRDEDRRMADVLEAAGVRARDDRELARVCLITGLRRPWSRCAA